MSLQQTDIKNKGRELAFFPFWEKGELIPTERVATEWGERELMKWGINEEN